MTERDVSTEIKSELCEHDQEAVSVFHRIGRKDKDYKEIRKNVTGGHSQQAKKLFSTSTCVVLLISMAVYFTYINVQARNQALSLNATVYTSKELGLVIHKLQGERDQTVLSINKIGSDSKLFLAKSYVDTNAVLQTLKQWPVNLQRDLATEFANKSAFQQYIVKHRRELNEATAQTIDEIDFYADMIKVLIRWLHDTIKEVILGVTWQSLVSYQKLVSCTEEVGIMRSIGISFFSNGGFTHHSSYVRFNKLVAAFFTNYRVAYIYSDLILPLKETAMAFSGYDLHAIIETYTRQIQHENISLPSTEHASYWFDNMTLYLDMLLSKQDELWWDMVAQIEVQSNRAIPGIIASVFVIVITAIASPTMIGVVYRLVTYIKRYVTAIAETTHNIVVQRQQTADQLRCRVPLPLADRLLAGEDLTSDYFASATVLVCQLAKAHSLPTRHPAEVIGQVARELHQTVQQMARSHDAYVLFYGSTKFVVVSGICEDSRDCHASKIVDMAVAVKKKIGRNGFPTDSGRRIGVCMGIHSGGCLAIILGDAFIEMRCLLAGHAIDGATRLKKTCTSSQAITIRVSGATKRLLAEPVVYHFDRAADIVLPGEDIEIETYWLRG